MVGHCPIPRDVDSEFKDGQGVTVAVVSTNEGGPLRLLLLLRSLPDTVVVLVRGAAMADPQRDYDKFEMNRVIMKWISGACH